MDELWLLLYHVSFNPYRISNLIPKECPSVPPKTPSLLREQGKRQDLPPLPPLSLPFVPGAAAVAK